MIPLSASVSADDMTDISYKWYKREKSVDDGYEFYTRKFISETESPELTVEFGGKASCGDRGTQSGIPYPDEQQKPG